MKRIVTRSYFILSILLFSTTIRSQALDTVILTSGVDTFTERWIFSESRFHSTTSSHSQMISVSKGYYVWSADTLIMFHEALSDPTPSKVEILKHEDLDREVCELFVHVNNLKGHPIRGATIAYFRGGKIVDGVIAQSDGNARIFLDEPIDSLQISWVGHREITFDMKGYWGKRLDLKVTLSDRPKYNTKERLTKWIFNSDTTLFRSENSDYLLRRIK